MAGSCAINIGKLQRIFSYCFYINVLSFSQYLISIFTIDYVSALKNILSFNLNMSVQQPKRRCFLTLIFHGKSVFKNC